MKVMRQQSRTEIAQKIEEKGRPRVVIVGAGFGGLATVEALANAEVDVTLIDRHNFATFQPLLYQVATAGLNPGDVAFPVRTVLRSKRRMRFVQGVLASHDAEDKYVTLEDGRSIGYDYLVLAVGASANYFGIEGAREHSHAIYTLDEAIDVRNHVFRLFEEATAHGVRSGELTFVVVGGGPTGVELAGAVAELARKALYTDYTTLNPDDVKVILVEQRPRVLEPFHPDLSEYARKELRERGVTVLLGESVQEVLPHKIMLKSGREIPNGIVLWAAGVATAPVVSKLGLPTGQGGRIQVGEDFRINELSHVFAIGDVALAAGKDGRSLPQLAQPAIQGGTFVGHAILKDLDGKPAGRFVYHNKGVMATIGRRAAVAEIGNRVRLEGTVAWLAWLGLHVMTLLGSRNKASVLLNWGWHYVSWGKGPRVILGG